MVSIILLNTLCKYNVCSWLKPLRLNQNVALDVKKKKEEEDVFRWALKCVFHDSLQQKKERKSNKYEGTNRNIEASLGEFICLQLMESPCPEIVMYSYHTKQLIQELICSDGVRFIMWQMVLGVFFPPTRHTGAGVGGMEFTTVTMMANSWSWSHYLWPLRIWITTLWINLSHVVSYGLLGQFSKAGHLLSPSIC